MTEMTIMAPAEDRLRIGSVELTGRLIHGTGKFPSTEVLRACLDAAQPAMITLAIRRLALDGAGQNELAGIDFSPYTLLPNTAGATTVDGAVRLAHLARAASLSSFIKVEVIGDLATLLPDPVATVEATRILAADGFTVLPYCSDDPVLARRLEEAGAAAVMPGAAPIGTALGIHNPFNIRLIIEQASVPVIVDAGLGVPSEAARCLEWGAAAVLVNSAIARAGNPPEMARAFAEAVVAGRRAHLAGRAPRSRTAVASSPATGLPESSS